MERAAPTVDTDCNTVCDCVIDVDVTMAVDVWEGYRYKVKGG
jgi:hypothetical protein